MYHMFLVDVCLLSEVLGKGMMCIFDQLECKIHRNSDIALLQITVFVINIMSLYFSCINRWRSLEY